MRVSTRIGTTPQGARCGTAGSHASARGLRLYYGTVEVPSNLGLQIAAEPLETYLLDSDGGPCGDQPSRTATTFTLVDTAPGAGAAKCRDSAAIKFAGGNAWQLIGTWKQSTP